MLKKGDIIELEIEDLALGGEGIARINDFVVFVRGGVPGDIIKAKLTQIKSSYSMAEIVVILKPSGNRITSSCPYYGECGGCCMGHLNYESQVYFKSKQVVDSMRHLGGFEEFAIDEIIPSEEIYGYRNKMEFTIIKADSSIIIGFHHRGRHDLLLDISSCLLASGNLNKILNDTREFIGKKNISVYNSKRMTGLLRYLVLKEGKNTQEVMVNVVTFEEDFPEIKELAEILRNDNPSILSIVQNINSRKSTIAAGEYEKVISGRAYIREYIGNLEFRISANSFFQTNTRQAEILFEIIKNYCEASPDDTILDLYCGTGAISLFLARNSKKVIGIELNQEAVRDARANALLNGISNCEFLQGEVRYVLQDILQNKAEIDTIVIDPPRSGLHPKATKTILEIMPKRIVYVSCNPATLARDLKILHSGGYRILKLQPVDMFPHTAHVECVAKLEK